MVGGAEDRDGFDDLGVGEAVRRLASENSEDVFGLALAAFEVGDGGSSCDVGGEDEVVEGEKGVFGIDRFLLGDVERGGGDLTGGEGGVKGFGVDERAASAVDKDGAGLHPRKGVRAENMVGFGGGRGVDGNEIRGGEEFIEVDEFDTVEVRGGLGDVGIVGDEAKGAEAADAGGESAADGAEPDDSNGAASDAPEAAGDIPDGLGLATPLASFDGGVEFTDEAGEREELGHGVVCNLGGVHSGCVAGEDAEPGSGIEVDGVDAYAGAGDDLEFGAGLEDFFVREREGADHGAIGGAHDFDVFVSSGGGAEGVFDEFDASGGEDGGVDERATAVDDAHGHD